MPPCKYHEICGLDALEGTGEDLCILHSKNPEKDRRAFDEALAEHRKEKGDNFSSFGFPGNTNFYEATFIERAIFSHATFAGGAEFLRAKFALGAYFEGSRFMGKADFTWAEVTEGAYFEGSRFIAAASFNAAKIMGRSALTDTEVLLLAAEPERTYRGTKFVTFEVAPAAADFTHVEFVGAADFAFADFIGGANFRDSKFAGGAKFLRAKFTFAADFSHANFTEGADFHGAKFNEGARAYFRGAEFTFAADFRDANFTEGADFNSAKFNEGANFEDAELPHEVDFSNAKLLGPTLFACAKEIGDIFAGAKVNFMQVTIDPLDALTFHNADLQQCRFQGTDMRKVEITCVSWCKLSTGFRIGTRFGVYDEIARLEEDETRPWSDVERLYRELRQNYEDRKDYERAGDFHYGEKELLRKNPETPRVLRFLLTLYWLVSGYGELYLRPVIWATGLIVVCAVLYLALGLYPKNGGPALSWTSGWDWLESTLYSFRVMTLLKPDDFVPDGLAAKFLNAIQSILGPIILGLFALAVRQRLKR